MERSTDAHRGWAVATRPPTLLAPRRPSGVRVRPPFPYVGSKTMIAAKITVLLPAHRHYVEVCGGSLAVLLAKTPSEAETVNDLDGDLVTFWRVLRDQPEALERACVLTPHSRVELYEAIGSDASSEVERARQVWVRLTQNTLRTTEQRHDFWVKRIATGSHPHTMASWASRLAPAAARLHRVSIDQRPAVEMLDMYDKPGCLLYIDPPYPGSVRYPHHMDDGNHLALVNAIATVNHAALAVSGYPDTVYDTALTAVRGWARHPIAARAQVPMGRTVPRTEILWTKEAPC
ncbi:DNA adenine methylase [Lactobacillus amylovorus]|uniref:DNA adenine methylase n=1 Tax=Lactobacillus amylovorus TaxID=1604 RepID=UPI003F8B484A